MKLSIVQVAETSGNARSLDTTAGVCSGATSALAVLNGKSLLNLSNDRSAGEDWFSKASGCAEAQSLAEALSNYDDIDRALAAYNAVRQPLSQRIVLHARKLGTQLGVGIETDEDRRLSKLLQTAKGIMDWIAVPNFLEMRV